MLKLSYHITTRRKETISLMSKSITQDMAYRQSLMKYAEKYGVSRASRKYNKSRSYIYFWKQRWDGSVASLGCQSRRPHGHPNQHTEAELKLIRDMRRRKPTLGMIELWHRLRGRGRFHDHPQAGSGAWLHRYDYSVRCLHRSTSHQPEYADQAFYDKKRNHYF